MTHLEHGPGRSGGCPAPYRAGSNIAHVKQSRPDPGLEFHIKVHTTFYLLSCFLFARFAVLDKGRTSDMSGSFWQMSLDPKSKLEHGTYKTAKARSGPRPSYKSPKDLLSCFLFARKRCSTNDAPRTCPGRSGECPWPRKAGSQACATPLLQG